MSGSAEVDLKVNKRGSVGGGSTRTVSNIKGGKGPAIKSAGNTNEEESLVGTHSSSLQSAKMKLDGLSPTKGNICATNSASNYYNNLLF